MSGCAGVLPRNLIVGLVQASDHQHQLEDTAHPRYVARHKEGGKTQKRRAQQKLENVVLVLSISPRSQDVSCYIE